MLLQVLLPLPVLAALPLLQPLLQQLVPLLVPLQQKPWRSTPTRMQQ
jgi:hypothetical protein